MTSDEREIFHYLKTWGSEFINAKEIALRATTKKRFYEEPDWAKPVLMSMAERGILECDLLGRYRIKPVPHKKKDHRWVAPDIAKILKEGGVEVDEQGELGSDEYYDQL